MLQFITRYNNKYSIIEQVKMVLEAGCKWIQLSLTETDDEELKTVTREIIQLCKEADAILILENNINIIKEIDVLGTHITQREISANDVRSILEGGPIIGITANTAEDIISLKGIDVDYVTLELLNNPNENTTSILNIEDYRKIVTDVRNAGIDLPIVAKGNITVENIDDIMTTGINGIAMDDVILNAEDPIQYTKSILKKLYNK